MTIAYAQLGDLQKAQENWAEAEEIKSSAIARDGVISRYWDKDYIREMARSEAQQILKP